MKQQIDMNQWDELAPFEKRFLETWLTRKGYTHLLTIGQCMEFLIATTYELHFESSDGRFFNKILTNQESSVGWDGEELIDILWYEVSLATKKRIALARTFVEEVF